MEDGLISLIKMKQSLSKNELVDQLKSQLFKLETFNSLFDSGNWSIAIEIAVKLRVIFHNTDKSKSLLALLKMQHVHFLDTSDKFNPRSPISHWGLLIMTLGERTIANNQFFQPKLNDSTTMNNVSFENWWNNKKILKGFDNNTFTRKKLILEVANKDGGAHVDEYLNEDYRKLSRENSIGWSFVTEQGEKTPFNNPVLPSIRQISYEAIETFRRIDIEKESKLK